MLLDAGRPDRCKILNDDFPLQHNTHTLPQRTAGFNSTIPKEGKEFTYTQPEPEPCEVKCDIHAWMHGWHFPLDHPYAAVSGPNGEFEIKNVPAGEHSFRVWAEGASRPLPESRPRASRSSRARRRTSKSSTTPAALPASGGSRQ